MTFAIPLNYRPLSAATLPDYLAQAPALRARLGGGPEDWTLREVSDGYLNLVYLVNGPDGSLCTKQSLPHVREDKDWPLPLDRTASEHLYWRTIGPYAPGLDSRGLPLRPGAVADRHGAACAPSGSARPDRRRRGLSRHGAARRRVRGALDLLHLRFPSEAGVQARSGSPS